MITAEELNKKLNQYMSSSNGEKAIHDAIALNGKFKTKMDLNYGAAVESLGYFLEANLPDGLVGSVHINDLLFDISEATQNPDNTMQINIHFNKKALRRASLRPDKYPNGAEDIVGLFVNGWDLDPEKKKIWGRWERPDGTLVHKHVQNTLHRDATDFIKKAVDQFLRLDAGNFGVIACNVDDYYVAK